MRTAFAVIFAAVFSCAAFGQSGLALAMWLATWLLTLPAAAQVTNVPCNQLPALTGDITSGAGSCGTSYAVLPARSLYKLIGVNFNSANTDTQLTIVLPTGAYGYAVTRMSISNASASLSTATIGLFSAAGGGGTTLIANNAITVTTGSPNTGNNLIAFASSATTAYNFTTLFARVGTAEGSAATGDITFEFTWVY